MQPTAQGSADTGDIVMMAFERSKKFIWSLPPKDLSIIMVITAFILLLIFCYHYRKTLTEDDDRKSGCNGVGVFVRDLFYCRLMRLMNIYSKFGRNSENLKESSFDPSYNPALFSILEKNPDTSDKAVITLLTGGQNIDVATQHSVLVLKSKKASLYYILLALSAALVFTGMLPLLKQQKTISNIWETAQVSTDYIRQHLAIKLSPPDELDMIQTLIEEVMNKACNMVKDKNSNVFSDEDEDSNIEDQIDGLNDFSKINAKINTLKDLLSRDLLTLYGFEKARQILSEKEELNEVQNLRKTDLTAIKGIIEDFSNADTCEFDAKSAAVPIISYKELRAQYQETLFSGISIDPSYTNAMKEIDRLREIINETAFVNTLEALGILSIVLALLINTVPFNCLKMNHYKERMCERYSVILFALITLSVCIAKLVLTVDQDIQKFDRFVDKKVKNVLQKLNRVVALLNGGHKELKEAQSNLVNEISKIKVTLKDDQNGSEDISILIERMGRIIKQLASLEKKLNKLIRLVDANRHVKNIADQAITMCRQKADNVKELYEALLSAQIVHISSNTAGEEISNGLDIYFSPLLEMDSRKIHHESQQVIKQFRMLFFEPLESAFQRNRESLEMLHKAMLKYQGATLLIILASFIDQMLEI